MDGSDVRDYKRPGTLEYVLCQAGLVRVERAADRETLTAGPELPALFDDRAVPPLTNVIPPLLRLVTALALDASGFVATNSIRTPALNALRAEGMTPEGVNALAGLLRRAADAAREDVRRALRMYR